MIIVSNVYTYEKPTNPYVIIEVKMPDVDFDKEKIKRYNPLKVENNYEQLQVQFEHCKYIIFTDCITWYFLKRENFFKADFNDKISLIKTCNNEWKQEDSIWGRLKSKIVKISKEAKINV